MKNKNNSKPRSLSISNIASIITGLKVIISSIALIVKTVVAEWDAIKKTKENNDALDKVLDDAKKRLNTMRK